MSLAQSLAGDSAPQSYHSLPVEQKQHTLDTAVAAPTQPSSSGEPIVVRLRGTGTSISLGGLYSSYDEDFPEALRGFLTPHEFDKAITKINDNLANNSPCLMCGVLQYLCCPCTLGLSICCVRTLCMDVARTTLMRDLDAANYRSNVEWTLAESWRDTWLELRVKEQ